MKKTIKSPKKFHCDNNLHLLSDDRSSISQNVFNELMENFPDIIHSVDKNGHIVSTNKKATELLGYTHDELIGMSIKDLYDPALQEQMLAGFNLLKSLGRIDQIESKLRAKSGELIEVEIRSFSLYDHYGKFVQTFSIIRDIREVIRLRSHLVQKSKMAAIGELSSGIANDLHNPLTLILSYNNILLKRASEERNFELVEKCQVNMAKAGARMEQLCAHLQNYSRNENEKVTQFMLSELAEDCLLMLENKTNQVGAKVDNQLKNNHKMIISQRNCLEQVLINVIGNACDALKDRLAPLIVLSAEVENEIISFKIRDNGHGIPEQNLETIFDVFYTTKKRRHGAGLGLSISREIIERLGGQISVKSQVDQGTEFRISVPLGTDRKAP